MKKILVTLFVMFLAVSASFALEMSAGGGIVYGYQTIKIEFDGALSALDETQTSDGFGVFGYFDATYAMVSVGYHAGEHTGFLDSSIVGKYPIKLGKCAVFPMAGAGYARAVKTESGKSKDDSSNFYLKGGIGGDIPVTQKLYIRPTASFIYNLDNKYVKDLKDDFDAKVTNYVFEFTAALGYKL